MSDKKKTPKIIAISTERNTGVLARAGQRHVTHDRAKKVALTAELIKKEANIQAANIILHTKVKGDVEAAASLAKDAIECTDEGIAQLNNGDTYADKVAKILANREERYERCDNACAMLDSAKSHADDARQCAKGGQSGWFARNFG